MSRSMRASRRSALPRLGHTPDSQSALVATGELRSEINNGGFDQYVFNSGGCHAPTEPATASDAGVTALVDLLDSAMAVVGSPFKIDSDERQAAMMAAALYWLSGSASGTLHRCESVGP